MRKNKHGEYYYKVHDAKTNELLAEGFCKEVAVKMMWDTTYPLKLALLNEQNPNRKPRYERVEREWIEHIFEVFDRKTSNRITGNWDECAKVITDWLGHDIKNASMEKYMYNLSPRFRVKRLNNV